MFTTETIGASGQQEVTAGDGTVIPLPQAFVRPGAEVTTSVRNPRYVEVTIAYAGGLSHDAKSALRALGVGTGTGLAKTAASRFGFGGILTRVLGFAGGRVINVIVGVALPIETARRPVSFGVCLPDGKKVMYNISGIKHMPSLAQ